ncbi:DUF488 domain-containing protein [Selenomonas ruminantium]|uniref:Uncharacterized conserved protein YeaO, DUF488 family n=1 Tax=Selenomonas ruminantium TaxID=971 RepID=A0A1H0RXS6_SELRU|nr:DUF488 family protein [Selenomonas ruminantium]SDP34371.1 Uncharacterized conserved protein YeaO, DUF488 family [Selenomonas ruminantium]
MDHELRLKRVYEPYELADGYRILVDRLWPRGIKKEAAHLDEWAKEITPSTEIRRLYHQGEMPFEGFSQAYLEELESNEAAEDFVHNCSEQLKVQNVTLVYAAKNEQENHALVCREWLKRKIEGGKNATR